MADIALSHTPSWLEPTSLARFAWRMAIRARWAVLAGCTVFILLDPARLWPAAPLAAWLAVYNGLLGREPAGRGTQLAWSLLPDVITVTAAVRLLGGIGSDAYLAYLFIIVILAVAYRGRGAAVGAAWIALAYSVAVLGTDGTLAPVVIGRLGFRIMTLGGIAWLSVLVVRQHEARVAHLRDAGARLQHAAHSDPLTGLWNRRALYTRLAEEIERARRYDRPLAVLLLDMDRLKEVNDRNGHLAGDEALQAVAAALTGALRGSDQAYRYGGDEFVLVLPETNRDDAIGIAARVRAAVQGIVVHGTALNASVGCGAFPADGAGPRDLIAAADRALYATKDV